MVARNNDLTLKHSKTNIYLEAAVLYTIVLFVYAAISKLINYEQAREQMLNQVFTAATAKGLTWAIPAAELITVLLLSIKRTLLAGLWCSLGLMASFTLYIILGLSHMFSRLPCSCGGILENMSWGTHLVFNIASMMIIISGLILYLKERRPVTKSDL